MVELAAGFADRLLSEIPVAQNADSEDLAAVDRQRIERAYWLLYGRPAGEQEIRLGLEFLGTKAREAAPRAPDDAPRSGPAAADPWTQYAQVLLATNELLYVD